LNDEQLVQRGVSAQELLDNPTFHDLYKELLDHYVSTILSSSPNDEAIRSSSYFQCRSLQDLIALLQQWAAVKDNIINNPIEED
jgi:hypothetical protein